jgi:hypothetical protein
MQQQAKREVSASRFFCTVHDRLREGFMRIVNGVVDLFDFETLEKALHRRFIVAVGFSAHALQVSMLSEAFSKRPGRCGRSALFVVD